MEDYNYKKLYREFRKSVINEENREQIIFTSRKTCDAVTLVEKIAQKEGLSDRDTYLAKVYTFIFHFRLVELNKKAQDDNETFLENINQIQQDFLKKVSPHFKLSSEETKQISDAIADFKVPVGRKSPMSIKLAHDALTSIFAKKKITKKLNSIFSEMEFYFPALKDNFKISSGLVDYISQTKYYTEYASQKNLAKKIKNKQKLISYVQKQKDGSSLLNNKHAMTMIKTSSRNQVDLVSIADKKAGIMITVNSILLTILIPMFASYIFDFSRYIIPIGLLTVTSGLTILFATLATRPSLVNNEATDAKISTGQKSIFYFKNFSNLSKSDFVEEARDLITRDTVFEQSVLTDLYDVGIDLDLKYKRLRWCYTIFGAGIILTMISFLASITFTAL